MAFIRRLMSSEGFRFLLSGTSLFILDFSIYLLCRKVFGIEVFWAELMARSTGATAGFLLHKFFTFANPKGANAMSVKTQGAGYFGTAAFNLMFSPILVSYLVWIMDPYELMAKVLGSVLLAVETFLVFRFVFRESK